MSFKDHFSPAAAAYAAARPTYPDGLFRFVAEHAPARRLVWDCATGSGQAARDLARYFERVIATDASDSQIAHAAARKGVEYRVARAEDSGLPDASADAVTVATALHWLDFEAFYCEARRVLAPRGVIAVWSYGSLVLPPPLGPMLHRFEYETMGSYWPPERRADSVRAYLVSKGAERSRIETIGMGKTVPAKFCPDIKNRKELIACLAPNRRAIIAVKGPAR